MIEENVDENAAVIEQDDERVPERSPTKKLKLSPLPDSELSEKIAKQLDYYFSDVNVIKDKFLQEKFKEDDGWVKLSVLLTFVRLKELTNDEKRIVQALKERESDVVVLDETKLRVRRKEPMPDAVEFQKQLNLRTVHISGFPTDYGFEQLRRFCSQFGEVESVAMRRRFKTKFFKGCIHVVFKKEADAKKVLETEVLKCKDRELQKESMEEYHRRKAEMAEKRQNRIKEKKGDGDEVIGKDDVKKGGEQKPKGDSKEEFKVKELASGDAVAN